MPVIDLHAHVTPERYKQAIESRGQWHGLDSRAGELDRGGFARPLSHRLEEMDRFGVDIQLVTPTVGFYQYDNDLEVTKLIHRECNDEIYEMTTEHPDRFLGMAMLPMQDTASAIAELERAIRDLGFKEPSSMTTSPGSTTTIRGSCLLRGGPGPGALIFFHQGGDDHHLTELHKLPNAVGNLTERTMVRRAHLRGVLDRFQT
jgi:hypothetical protein